MANIDQDLQAIMQARYGRDVRQSIHDAIYDINEESTAAKEAAIDAQDSAVHSAEAAASSETNAASSATEAESYAHGGTGSRPGEDTDNAKYYCERAESITGPHVEKFNGRTGEVAPAYGDYDISQIGATGGTAGQVPVLNSQGRWEPADAPSSGHTIKNQAGIATAQRDNLQFMDIHVSDDSVSNATKIEAVKEITSNDFENLGNNEDGIYHTYDDDSDYYFTAEEIEYYDDTTVKQALDRHEASMGHVENGSTSTAPYIAGEYIIHEDKFYEVKSAIAVDDAFDTSINGNIEEKSIGEVLSQLNSNLVERTIPYTLIGGWAIASSDGAVFNVKNGVAVFNFSVWQNNAISGNTWVTIGSVTNAEDRPTINTYCPCLLDSTTMTNSLMRITPQGDIEIKVSSAQSSGIKVFKGCLSYIIN